MPEEYHKTAFPRDAHMMIFSQFSCSEGKAFRKHDPHSYWVKREVSRRGKVREGEGEAERDSGEKGYTGIPWTGGAGAV